ncbi:MAG: hypothetical protein JNK37_13610 [Verrucomicrobiales bacterium]|nr:hypothetical protein [Verrucomicrobiales bacterium]
MRLTGAGKEKKAGPAPTDREATAAMERGEGIAGAIAEDFREKGKTKMEKLKFFFGVRIGSG